MVYWLNIFHEVYSLSEILVGNRTLGECSKKTILAINDLEALNASLILRHPNFKIPQRNQILLPLMPLIDHLNLNG